MTRDRCPARQGKSDHQLAIIDAMDVPACLVFPRRRPGDDLLPDDGHGPCEDCVPDFTWQRRIAARWRRLSGRLRRHGRR